jgi:UDPglucose 6-dehydrogenase
MDVNLIRPSDATTRFSARIAILGTNYVGLVTAACLAHLGHMVIGIDVDPLKVARLRRGVLPVCEPGLQDLVVEQLAVGRLRFTLDYAVGLRGVQLALVCVCSLPAADGGTDLREVRAAVASLARHTPTGARLVVVNKSALPVGTGDWMQNALEAQAVQANVRFAVVNNPEFLREGSAVADFRRPYRLVVGGSDPYAVDAVANLYRGISRRTPIVRTTLSNAEMIMYASDAC